MNQEMQMKLMAFVDGELSDREGRSVAEIVARDQDVAALVSELRMSQSMLVGNEPERKLSESREFYWSKIERAIARGELAAETEARPSAWLAWRRFLAPLAVVALVVFLSVVTINDYDFSLFGGQAGRVGEVENHSEHTSSFSFRSHSENMFVVWVYDKAEDAATDADVDAEPDDDDAPAK